ncbi:SCO family protein [Virgibacillus doumboii]|uniref:SCO family protein n=1 Tax=Virgibacillus doumboii TaxID=2697503 RepID=UPI0013E0032F|nr:SCO family protein [Virgibacillus doumboii]
MTASKIILPLLILFILLSACGNTYEGDFSYDVKKFTFTNQNGETISKEDMAGKFWIADFIFTNCTTVCPPMTSNMVYLQGKLKKAGLEDVQLLSFSIDPKRDTHEKMKTYVKNRGGTLDNWHLFTGYEFEKIKEFSIKSFKAPVDKIADSDQFIHSTGFYLVSPEGNAIKQYNGNDKSEMKKIVQDIKDMS